MSDIPPIHVAAKATGLNGLKGVASRSNGSPAEATDSAEISALGQRLSALAGDPNLRLERIQEIRQAIDNGTYETPEKIEATVSRLIGVLREES